jgi:DNA-binding transcriptional MerR regulator
MIIGELSARTGVSTRSLRYYEKLGLLTADRSDNGYRHYDEDAVQAALTIRSMFDLGFPADMVRTALACVAGDHEGVDQVAIRTSVAQMRDDIADRIAELTRVHATLSAFVDEPDGCHVDELTAEQAPAPRSGRFRRPVHA